jgi:hypothetical protein
MSGLLSSPGAMLVDTFRALHPTTTEAYSCWSQQTGKVTYDDDLNELIIVYDGSCRRYLGTPNDLGAAY